MEQHGGRSPWHGSARPRPQQAGPGLPVALLLLLALPLAGCVGTPSEGPLEFWKNAFGEPLQGRPLPPGAEGAYPNLASVPPAPPRGSASEREALSAALAEARGQSRLPVEAGRPVPPPPAGAEGAGLLPAAPPAPPRLAAAPPVRALPPGQAGDQPGAAPELPADPGMAPAPPPAELLAPAPEAPALQPGGVPAAPRL